MTCEEFLTKAKKILDIIEISKKKGLKQYYIYDENLGWKLNKNAKHNSLPYSTNSKGLRNTGLNNNKKKIVLIGDSMVHGDEVGDKETWAYFLAKKTKKKYDVLNLGVSGYGCDQAYLKFKKFLKKEKKIDIAMFCFNSGIELRNINIQRLFLNKNAQFPFLKPRFILKNHKIKLLLPPKKVESNYFDFLKSKRVKIFLKKKDFFYPTFFKNFLFIILNKFRLNNSRNKYLLFNRKKTLLLTLKIFDLFCTLCKKKNIKPIIIFLPKLQGEFKDEENLNYLKKRVNDMNINNFYPKNIFFDKKKNLIKKYYEKNNHYSAAGGNVIANSIFKYLKKKSKNY